MSCRRMKSCSAVAWNPVNSTQLVAACDHHLSPTLHRWDLRSPNMPFELLGHDQVGLGLLVVPPHKGDVGRRGVAEGAQRGVAGRVFMA